jgi:Lar family restriction alleviation protein
MTDLLPCPFCGSPARDDLLPHSSGPGWVQCSSCEVDQHMSDTLEEAVARWNRRAPQPLGVAQAEAEAAYRASALSPAHRGAGE